jgi:hypothetical protein
MQNPENLYDNRLAASDKVNWIPEEIKIGIHLGSACYHHLRTSVFPSI